MKFLSPLFSAVSGSIAGTTFYSSGGLIARARALPTNPNSQAQQNARTALGTASAEWQLLTDDNRADWDAYAAATPTTDKVGNTITLTGLNMWQRWCSLRELIGESITMPSPLAGSGFGVPPGNITAEATTPAINVEIPGGAPNSGDMIVQISPKLGDGQQSLAQPLTFEASAAVGIAATTVAVTPVTTIALDDRFVMRARIVYDDGRVSQTSTEIVTVAAS